MNLLDYSLVAVYVVFLVWMGRAFAKATAGCEVNP